MGKFTFNVFPGRPKTLAPDFSFVDKEAKLKQINSVEAFFKTGESVSFWQNFYENLQDGSGNYEWILESLPRQQPVPVEEPVTVPENVQALLEMETEIPEDFLEILEKRRWKKKNITPSSTSQKTSSAKGSTAKCQKKKSNVITQTSKERTTVKVKKKKVNKSSNQQQNVTGRKKANRNSFSVMTVI